MRRRDGSLVRRATGALLVAASALAALAACEREHRDFDTAAAYLHAHP